MEREGTPAVARKAIAYHLEGSTMKELLPSLITWRVSTMKKRLSLAILLIMLVAFVAPAAMAADSRESHKQKAGAGAAKAGKTAPEGILLTWTNDGATKVTDPAFDTYFKAGALAGVEALLDAGKVYVNGRKIPATENEVTVYQVNKVNAIYKTETGWGYSVHKTTSANDMAFKDSELSILHARPRSRMATGGRRR